MNITVNVDAVTLASEVDGTYIQTGEEEWSRRPLTLADLVAEKIITQLRLDTEPWQGLRQRFIDIRDDAIKAAVEPMVAEAIATPIQQTNAFGEPNGKPTTLRELIAAEARKALDKPMGNNYDRNKKTFLADTVEKAVAEAFTAEIKAEVTRARNAVVGEIGKQVSAGIQTAVKAGLAANR